VKALVAYFSCTGNTKRLAARLAKVVGGELYEIAPEIPYTARDLDWEDMRSRSSVEMKDERSRPAIAAKSAHLEACDVVFVGFPIWWYRAPSIINTFLESYDFGGKTVVPFATSGSSGIGDTDRHLHPSCSAQTKWRPAKRLAANESESDLKKWVESLKL
jgi:flavodoxin